ncbi:hypothetical protein [Streptomyces sp. B1I3]|uniref:hypothetical protein n=1 Tax=Streptomyces sp. B1I3 TaxID=3042264 RepID=UPI0027803B79|nr:hypothetical protein [Streptomyces sp. B1I3]MDQ0791867.1 hypothetical protein [Streptomyces sp. B1I3]
MTTFVITVPGTFVHGVTDTTRSEVERRLRPQDPQNTELGETEDLDILTVQDGNTFSLRLEVDADDRAGAEAEAVRLATAALRESGVAEADAPLGAAVVTGIDSEY